MLPPAYSRRHCRPVGPPTRTASARSARAPPSEWLTEAAAKAKADARPKREREAAASRELEDELAAAGRHSVQTQIDTEDEQTRVARTREKCRPPVDIDREGCPPIS
jgi:hypothetical protein